MANHDQSSAQALPADSLQARIEQDGSGEFLKRLLEDFDGKLRQIEHAKQTAGDDDNEQLQQLQATLSTAGQTLQKVWGMYHGDI